MRKRSRRSSARPRRTAPTSWSLGDMIGRGPTRSTPWPGARALRRGADGQPRLRRDRLGRADAFGEPGSPAVRSTELAGERLERRRRGLGARASRRRRGAVRAGTAAPRRGARSSAPRRRRVPRGPADHARTRRPYPRGGRLAPDPAGRPHGQIQGLPLGSGTAVAAEPGAVAAPATTRLKWWDALDAQAADGAYWLLLDLERRTATWRREPYARPRHGSERAGSASTDPWLPIDRTSGCGLSTSGEDSGRVSG